MKVERKSEEPDGLKTKLLEASSENTQLMERIKCIEALLEVGQVRQAASPTEVSQLQSRLQEKVDLASLFKKEAMELHAIVKQWKPENNDLCEKTSVRAVEALAATEKACEEKLLAATKAKAKLEQQLDAVQDLSQQTLLSVFPEVTISSPQTHAEYLRKFKKKTLEMLRQHGRDRITQFGP